MFWTEETSCDVCLTNRVKNLPSSLRAFATVFNLGYAPHKARCGACRHLLNFMKQLEVDHRSVFRDLDSIITRLSVRDFTLRLFRELIIRFTADGNWHVGRRIVVLACLFRAGQCWRGRRREEVARQLVVCARLVERVLPDASWDIPHSLPVSPHWWFILFLSLGGIILALVSKK